MTSRFEKKKLHLLARPWFYILYLAILSVQINNQENLYVNQLINLQKYL